MRTVRLTVDGRLVREFEIELASGEPDFWAFTDISEFHGRTMAIESRLPADSGAVFDAVTQSDAIRGTENLYRETYPPAIPLHAPARLDERPQRPGLRQRRVPSLLPAQSVRHEMGQHDVGPRRQPRPRALDRTGRRHPARPTGHDLLPARPWSTTATPPAFGPATKTRSCACSPQPATRRCGRRGSRLPRHSLTATTAGARGRSSPATQCSSTLSAETATPKLVWHAATKRWILALYLDKNDYGLFASPNLKDWTQLQTITVPDCSECPDFFPISARRRREKRQVGVSLAANRPLLGRRVRRPEVHVPGWPARRQLGRLVLTPCRATATSRQPTAAGFRSPGWPVASTRGCRSTSR